jgi:TolB-like protein/DNA-binding winged helix-turn-helix (wHTH) protein
MLNPQGNPAENDRRSRVAAAAGPVRVRFDRYVLDLERGCLFLGQQEVAIRPKAYDLLRYMLEHAGCLVTKDEILETIWPDAIVTEDSITQCVAELRRALQDNDQNLVKTVQRRGYRLDVAPTAEYGSELRSASEFATQGGSQGRAKVSWTWIALVIACLVVGAGLGAAFLMTRPIDSGAPESVSLAVIPFADLTGRQLDTFAAGITIDLTSDLSRIPGLSVIAPATAQKLGGQPNELQQDIDALNVRYLIVGDIREVGPLRRIGVRLLDAKSRVQLWDDRFDLGTDEIADWQDEVVGRIATALNVRLANIESERTLRERRYYPDAYDLSVQGWTLIYAAKTPKNYAAARVLFEQALERNPRSQYALSGLGWSLAISVLSGWTSSPKEDSGRVEEIYNRLLIEPNHAIGHQLRGFMLRLAGRTAAAREAFQTAAVINPNFAPAHAQFGVTEIELGHPQEAIKSIQRALRLSPRDPDQSLWISYIGMSQLHEGSVSDAAATLARALEVDTSSSVPWQHAYLASALMLAARTQDAAIALAGLRRLKPAATISSFRAASRSVDSTFLSQQERFFQGLRLVGLPE